MRHPPATNPSDGVDMASAIHQTTAATGETIYWPAGEPKGGIVCLHGSEGGWAGWNDLQCALFAANGFAALSRNYSQDSGWLVQPAIDNVPLEGTATALAALREALISHACGVGLFGVSRGAEQALLLLQLLAEDPCETLPAAVAVHAPPDTSFPAFIPSDFQMGRPWAGPWVGDEQRPAWSWRGSHQRTKPGTLLGVDRSACPVFIAQGAEDDIGDPQMARRLAERMTRPG